MGTPPRVLVADSDATYRAQVAELIGRIGYSTLETDDGHQAVEIANREQPALVLLEVNLDGVSGYEVCRQLRDAFGDEIAIIFVSGDRTEAYDRVAGLLVGADDYVVKPFDEGELLARVRTALRNREFARPAGNGASTSSIASLTVREREVLRLLARGLTQLDIAGKLVISPKTVGTHIQRILTKLGVHSRAQAIVLAHREGLGDGNGRPFLEVEGHLLAAPLDAL